MFYVVAALIMVADTSECKTHTFPPLDTHFPFSCTHCQTVGLCSCFVASGQRLCIKRSAFSLRYRGAAAATGADRRFGDQ